MSFCRYVSISVLIGWLLSLLVSTLRWKCNPVDFPVFPRGTTICITKYLFTCIIRLLYWALIRLYIDLLIIRKKKKEISYPFYYYTMLNTLTTLNVNISSQRKVVRRKNFRGNGKVVLLFVFFFFINEM